MAIGYRDLRSKVARAAELLAGLPGEEPLAIISHKSPEGLALVAASTHLERPCLLLPVDLGARSRAALLDQAGCRFLLRADTHAVEEVRAPAAAPNLDGVSLLLTTSGSTGIPKIVPLPRNATAAFIDWAATEFGIGPGTVVFSYAPLNFDLSLLDVWTTLAKGGHVVLAEQDRAVDGKYLLGVFTEAAVEVVQAVPLFFRLLLDAADGRSFPAVRELVSTGEAMPPALAARLPEAFPNARLRNVYGSTETNDSFIHDIDPVAGVATPIGRPIDGVRALVVRDGQVVTGAGSGELWTATPFQSGRYLDPALTARGWVDAPTGDGTYFRTGDNVTRDADGVLRLDGRSDLQVKVRGVRTNLLEVEHVVTAHPAVHEAVVLGLPDDVAGHRLHAVVRLCPDATLNSLQLRQHCATRLPRTAIPSTMDIVFDPFPVSPNGKVDRAAVQASLREGVREHVAAR
ncbi:AMP-binding protein [Actinokineospora xionganensis]|uniref:AMP-binding protein n=1 Tax=Actinokineospora xionganensis TaxID=2684470 RepID=A0ABR7L4C6_9PSEU|nr:AMP-binding protein [Actinokineospora xionganensis]MBC6447539.1 AMP-binding protein [Actinokineospora xionganensis]